jgi:hypothetical protein
MLLLDDTSTAALAVDIDLPPNAYRLSEELMSSWPRLHQRIRYVEADMRAVEFSSSDLIMSVHACGTLTDAVLDIAVDAGARVAVLPCCHDLERCDTGGLGGWLDGPAAVDVTRAARLRARGYQVLTRRIPAEITPKNRLLMGHPEKG